MTRIPTPRAATRAASRATGRARYWAVPLVVASVAVASACSPIETTRPYSPSDGLRVDLTDDLRGLNLLVVSAAEGDAGALVGAFANDSTEDVEFDVTPEGGEPVTIPVAAGETVYLGAEDGFDAQIGRVDAAPGGMLPVTVGVTSGEEQSLSLPVLDGTLEEYAHLLP
ncbi:hypothetical protein [Cellulosimicrobium cellulans]|uniref:hypothetical protein n=1 Tax=Cellulosimicrobium cellulans TaxID=1710 RepID=UPI001F05B0E0|nr:hypothetical protein [Cellulosimicrobium cellulans]